MTKMGSLASGQRRRSTCVQAVVEYRLEFDSPQSGFNRLEQMSIDGKLLEILCCPISKSPLARLARSRLEKLNRSIAAGEVDQIDGTVVSEALSEALITADDKVIYPVIDDIPVLLSERGIGTTQLQDF